MIPKIGPLSESNNETKPKIYLFNDLSDLENAMLNWLGDNINDIYGDSEKLYILTILLPDTFPTKHIAFEATTEYNIPTKYISDISILE